MSDKETAPSMEVLELRAELAEAHSAVVNLTVEWHKCEIALEKARREAAEWRRVNVVDTARAVKRALSARSVARYARRMKAERDAARAECERWKNATMGENVKHALAVAEVAELERKLEIHIGQRVHFENRSNAAEADVARLTAAVGAAAALPEDWRIRREMLTLDSPYVCADELDAALRGDTAPAKWQE